MMQAWAKLLLDPRATMCYGCAISLFYWRDSAGNSNTPRGSMLVRKAGGLVDRSNSLAVFLAKWLATGKCPSDALWPRGGHAAAAWPIARSGGCAVYRREC